MPATIRLATAKDAPLWLALVQSVLGADYPAKEVYDPVWIARELEAPIGHETWVAEVTDGSMPAFLFSSRLEPMQTPSTTSAGISTARKASLTVPLMLC